MENMFGSLVRLTICAAWCEIHTRFSVQKTAKKVVLLSVCIWYLFSAYPIQAESSLVLDPTFQEINLEDGVTQKTATLSLQNQTNESQEFVISAVRVNQIDAQGNVIFNDKPLSPQATSEVDFIQLDKPRITLASGEKTVVTITIRNTQDLGPGGHYFALLVLTQDTQESKAGNQTVLPALSSFLLLRKTGGERYHISLKEVPELRKIVWTHLPTQLTLRLENQGNIHHTPRGQIILTDVFQRKVVEGTINESSAFVLPESVREIPVQLRRIRPQLPFMVYSVEIIGTTQPGSIKFEQRKQIIMLHPPSLFLIIISFTTATIYVRKKRTQLV